MSAPSAAAVRRKLFVTTALPYANGPFHIGHIMEYIQADIWVRFQRMQGHEVHFVGADDAHGAPIMLKARGGRHHAAGSWSRASPRTRAEVPAAASTSASTTGDSTALARERSSCRRTIYRALEDRRARSTRRPVEQFYDPVKGMFLPDRYIKGTCPNCGTQRTSTRDACECCSTTTRPPTSSIPTRRSPARSPELRSSEHFFFRLSDPQVRRIPRAAGLDTTGPPAARGAQQGRASGSPASGEQAAERTGTSRATRPYFGIPIPDAPGKVLLRLARRADRLSRARSRTTSTSGAARAHGETRSFEEFLAGADSRAVSTSSARTSSTSTRCSGRRC